jgi:hypothetical protein
MIQIPIVSQHKTTLKKRGTTTTTTTTMRNRHARIDFPDSLKHGRAIQKRIAR